MNKRVPQIIEFPKLGKSEIGYISIAEKANLPFPIKRAFWTYYTPEEVIRGKHAHFELEQILIAVSGRIRIFTESIEGVKEEFELTKPNQGIFIPKMNWHTMQFSHDAVLLSLSSMEYNESDYIRDYNDFNTLQNKWKNS